jgi:hypothetical protein
MMTKKDYIALAVVLRINRRNMSNEAFIALVTDMCGAFAADNDKFKSDLFVTACYKG